MTAPRSADVVHVQTQGKVASADIDYARTKVEAVFHFARDPILYARVRLTQFADPAVERPAVAQVNLDLNGRLIHARAARPTMHEAVDEMRDRLRDRLQRAAGDWEAIRGGRPVDEPHEWRHGSADH